MVVYDPSLMTDMYEYTMLDATLQDGTANRPCVFEVFTRHLPEGRRYGVVAGIGRLLDALEDFHLDDADLKFLSDRHIVSRGTVKWLENYHFTGSIRGYREGEVYFPNSPILQVRGSFGECTLLETLILSILNYDSAVAAAASRMVTAAKNRPCMDMGGRRTNEWAAVAAARASIVGGFKGTANLLAAKLYDLPAIGTAAHCFTLVHDSERQAFESQIAALGTNTTLLVDTYNIEEAVKTAVEVAGPNLGGVRIDRYAFLNVVQLQDLADLLEGEIYIDVEDDVSDLNVYRGYQDVRPVLAGFASYSYLNDIGGIDYPGTDPYKLRRHQQLIEAFLSDFSGQMEALSQQEQEALAQDIVDCLRTDLTAQDVQSWTGQVRRLHTAQILEGYENETDQDSYWIPDRSALKTWVIEHFYCGQDEEE